MENFTFEVENVLRYWRSALADEDMMGVDWSKAPVQVDDSTMRRGLLSPVDVKTLQGAWTTFRKQAERNQTQEELDQCSDGSIPVLMVTKGLSQHRSHGATIGNGSGVASYTLGIPANLTLDGQLLPQKDCLPWIGREFLTPNENATGNTPIVGDMAAVDSWISGNPLEDPSWAQVMVWCEGLWGQCH